MYNVIFYFDFHIFPICCRYPPIICLGLSAGKFLDDSACGSKSIGEMFAKSDRPAGVSFTQNGSQGTDTEDVYGKEIMMTQSSQKFIENCSGSHSKKSKPSILSFFKSKETEAQNMPKLGNVRDFKPNIFVNEGNQTQVVDCSSESESDNGFTQSNSSEGYIRSDSKHKLHLPDDPVSVKFDLENLGKNTTSSSKTDVSSFFIRTITPLTANTDCCPKNVHLKRGLETESFESKDMKKQSELDSSSAEITSFFKRKLLGLPHTVQSKTVTSKKVHDKSRYASNIPSVQEDCNRGCFVQENKTDCVEAAEGNGLGRDAGKLELNSFSQNAVISKEENSESETVQVHSEELNSVYENHVIPNTALDSGLETEMSKQALNCDRLNVIPVKEFQSGSENVVISLEDYLECEKCHKMMTVWEMPEHMDFHFALQLQEDMNVPLTGNSVATTSVKRKSLQGSQKSSKKMKVCSSQGKLDSFFSKN
ncbi:hypothetical protein DPMN_094396 [Dreissena polymorpha]|uniref:UBZ3-type domain-containing protein n=1 Tax=Dreissena polymorpha TaxID=45954 RepID=A0A9D4R1X2_DREPO|nr:hypothetical protein DPMN_094396 [Dreissena polymorpha]